MSTILDQMVSVVSSVAAINTTDVKVSVILNDIKAGQWKTEIARIRAALADKESKRLKKELPAAMWSGQFNTRDKEVAVEDKLVRHSGILCADLDHLGNRCAEIRTMLILSPFVIAIFLSPRGQGLKVLFRVKPELSSHAASYQAIRNHVMELTGCEIDSACKDVTRLCFVSHDQDLWINEVETKEIEPWTYRTHTVNGSCVSSGDSEGFVSFVSSVSTVDEAILKSLPRRTGISHKSLCKLAGALWAYEETSGTELTDRQLRDAVSKWYALAKPQLRPDQAEDECWLEFLDAWENIDHPLLESVVEKAWKVATANPMTPEALAHGLTSPNLCVLIALCRELQSINGDNPFFLSPYTLKDLYGHKSPSAAAKWLNGLCRLGILNKIEKGDLAKRMASSYRFNFHRNE